MHINLAKKVALVTGSDSEIGTAICKQLVESGARLAAVCQDTEVAENWHNELKKQGIEVTLYKADLEDFDDCNKLVQSIEDELGSLDIIVNSAETIAISPFTEMSKAQWDKLLDTNLDSLFNICKHATIRMSERGFGRIVNISSVKSRKGAPGQSHYGASKAGMHGFTMALAQEVGRKGITVNTVSPGFMEKDTQQEQIDFGSIPVSRPGQPEEIAYLVDFLCSDQAAYINGADVAINGGCYMN